MGSIIVLYNTSKLSYFLADLHKIAKTIMGLLLFTNKYQFIL